MPEQKGEFVHLHLHSAYSLSEGAIKIGKLKDLCLADRMPAVAVTDFSNLFALVKFYKAAQAAGVKPIVGCDVLVDRHFESLPEFRSAFDFDQYLAEAIAVEIRSRAAAAKPPVRGRR